MTFTSKLPRGVRRLFRLPRSRARFIREMSEEMQSHLAMRIEELRRQGMSDEAARTEALRRFGDSAEFESYALRRATQRARRALGREWLEGWAYELRYAVRQLWTHRAVTLIAILTLALGIGANTAIFSVVHRLLLSPLPYPDGNRIVLLTLSPEADGFYQPDAQTLRLLRSRSHALQSIGAVVIDAAWVQNDDGRDTVVAYVTPSYLDVLGIEPIIGRSFTAQEARSKNSGVAMISRSRWLREFDGSTSALGATVHVDSQSYTVIGVVPQEMAPPMSPESFNKNLHPATPGVWLPMSLDALGNDTHPEAYARLRPGISAEGATRELRSILDTMPDARVDRPEIRAMRAQDFLDPRETRMVQVLFAAVGVLLLIGCANVANLLMARAWARRREFAVRVALGAGRARLARQVLTESVILALAAGVLGVLVAWQGLHVIIALRPPALDHLAGTKIETPVLLWSAAVSIATGLLFGCGPALFAGKRDVAEVLKSEARSGSGSVASRRIRSSLVVLEIALSVMLLVGAGLLVRSLVALQQVSLGFEPRGLVSFFAPANMHLRKTILERLRGTPGVTDASFGTMPAQGFGDPDPLVTDPDAEGHARSAPGYTVSWIGPGYFRLSHITLLEGRLPDSTSTAVASPARPPSRDTSAGQHAAASAGPPIEIVINQSLARQLWPNADAVGARLTSPNARFTQLYTVVGVVNDVRLPGPQDPARVAQVYELRPSPMSMYIVRTAVPGAVLVPTLRKVFTDVDPHAFVQTVTIGEQFLRDALAPTVFGMALLTTFAIVALTLSAIGLYGVIAYAVTQRTREIGVRVALGADARTVALLVARGALRLTLMGVVVGAVAGVLGTRVLESLLYGVTSADPVTIGAVGLLVVTIAALASWVPTRRALGIDPVEALRTE